MEEEDCHEVDHNELHKMYPPPQWKVLLPSSIVVKKKCTYRVKNNIIHIKQQMIHRKCTTKMTNIAIYTAQIVEFHIRSKQYYTGNKEIR